jgi:class 3 adenylate cyclase
MTTYGGGGPRARRLASFLRRRARSRRASRAGLDETLRQALFQDQAIVFTDTADFTVRAARDGILHFLMLFDRLTATARPGIRRAGGHLVKVEGDSLLVRFPDAAAACRGVDAIEASLHRANRDKPRNERLRFSYGIGFGEVLVLEHDVFGLEVNLASKLGEDMARPGEALLTPSAAAALDRDTLGRVVPYRVATLMGRVVPVNRLRIARRG